MMSGRRRVGMIKMSGMMMEMSGRRRWDDGDEWEERMG